MTREFLNKSTARQVLIRNFGSLERAKDKLSDLFLMHSFSSIKAPLTKRVITYLAGLGYGVTTLYNVCSECGVRYSFSNLATDNYCMLCSNKNRYRSEMIVDPATYEELLHNLEVLRKYFDTPDDQSYAELIKATEEARDISRMYQQKMTPTD